MFRTESAQIEEVQSAFNESFFLPVLRDIMTNCPDLEGGRLVYISTAQIRNTDVFMSYDYGHPTEANRTVQQVMRRLKYYGGKTASKGTVKISKWRLEEIIKRFQN